MKSILALFTLLKLTEALLPFPSGTTNGVSLGEAFISIKFKQRTALHLRENLQQWILALVKYFGAWLASLAQFLGLHVIVMIFIHHCVVRCWRSGKNIFVYFFVTWGFNNSYVKITCKSSPKRPEWCVNFVSAASQIPLRTQGRPSRPLLVNSLPNPSYINHLELLVSANSSSVAFG